MTIHGEPQKDFKPEGFIQHLLAALMGPVRTAYATIGDGLTTAALVLVTGAALILTAQNGWLPGQDVWDPAAAASTASKEAQLRRDEALAESAEHAAEHERLRVLEKRAYLEAQGIDTWEAPDE